MKKAQNLCDMSCFQSVGLDSKDGPFDTNLQLLNQIAIMEMVFSSKDEVIKRV